MTDNEATIVDCDVLEAAKENIQPLGTGRRVTALSAILATPHAQRDSKLAATRTRLRINVEVALDDEEGDPLEAYCRLVYWTLENYPQGHSAESGLVELLEEATRTLKDDRGEIWRGDLRYMKLWLLYASYVEKPTIVYKFMIANDIGTQFGLLYEEFAAVLERDGRTREADEAYALGIARKASPLEHLETRYNDFQKRMMSNTSAHNASMQSERPQQGRPALATTAQTPSSSSSSRPNLQVSGSSSSNSRLQVFIDPSGSESRVAESINIWNDIGSRKSRVKENAPEVKKMVGTTLQQGRSKRTASGSGPIAPNKAKSSKIAVYRDFSPASEFTQLKSPEKGDGVTAALENDIHRSIDATPHFVPFRDETSSPTSTVTHISEPVIKEKKAGLKASAALSEAEALRKDPLKNYERGM